MNYPTPSKSRRFLKSLLNLAFSLALVCLLFVLLAGCSRNPRPEAQYGPSQMRALTATTVIATREKQFARTVEYVERVEAARSSDLGFELSGTLLAVHVEEGNRVEKGEILAVLDTARLKVRRAELKAANRGSEGGSRARGSDIRAGKKPGGKKAGAIASSQHSIN